MNFKFIFFGRYLISWTLFSLMIFGCAGNKGGFSDKADLHYRIGLQFLNQGEYLKAKAEFEIAAELDPNDPQIRNALGLALMGMGNFELAVVQFKRALQITTTMPEVYNNLGSAYNELKEYDKAIEVCTLALKSPGYKTPAAALFNLGVAYEGKRDYLNAIKHYELAIEKEPELFMPYYRLGEVLMAVGRYQEAISRFQFASKLYISDPRPYLSMAKAYIALNRKEEAKEALEKVIKLDPESKEAKDAITLLKSMREK